MEATFNNVGGMRCQGCVDKLEKFIGEIDGVERVQVDLSAKSV
ncbi:heavy-metal-associated domain-containing protein, partial [uncultured Helicobacter sp.]